MFRRKFIFISVLLSVAVEAGALEATWIHDLDFAPVIDGAVDRVWYGRPVILKHDPDDSVPYGIRVTAGLCSGSLYFAGIVNSPTQECFAEGDLPVVLTVYIDPTPGGEKVFEFSMNETGLRDDSLRGDASWEGQWDGKTGRIGDGKVVLYEMEIPLANLYPLPEERLPFLGLSVFVTLGNDPSRSVGWGKRPSSKDDLPETYSATGDFAAFIVRSVESFSKEADRCRTDIVNSGMRILEDEQLKRMADLIYRIQRLRQKVRTEGDRSPTEWFRLWRQEMDLRLEWSNLSNSLETYILAESPFDKDEDIRRDPRGKKRASESEPSVSPFPIPWARPYSRGILRVLAFAPYEAAWEVDELSVRADVDVTFIPLESSSSFAPGGWETHRSWSAPRNSELEKRIIDLLGDEDEEWDVILVGNFSWDSFPAEVRYKILETTAKGTGLAGIGLMVKGDDAFASNLRGDRLNGTKSVNPRNWYPLSKGREPILETMPFGRGRILRLDYGPMPESQSLTPAGRSRENPSWIDEYESAMSTVCRAVIWASGFEPENLISSSTGWGQPDGTIDVRFVGPIQKTYHIRRQIRSAGSIVEQSPIEDLDEKAAGYRAPMPKLPPGNYFGDVFLLDRDRVVDWIITPFTVEQ